MSSTGNSALSAFLAKEEMGSPIEAAKLGRPANGPAGTDEVDPDAHPDALEQHGKLVRWFEDAERASAPARAMSERDRDYFDGHQLDAATLAALAKRGQPPLVDNFICDKITLLCGMERKARTDPKAFPRTPNEEARSEAATQALRFLADDNSMPAIASAVYENILVEGYGGAELGLEDDGKGGANITITYVGWDRCFHDPHSRALDFSDDRYRGMVLWMDRDQLEDMYPDAGDSIAESFAPQSSEGYADKPNDVAWLDSSRQRCRAVQIYWVERGQWWEATITKAGYLSEPQKSLFVDRKGRSTCRLVLRAAYIDRKNHRYGVVRGLISGQDAINKRQSKALHLLSVNRVIAEQGAVRDVTHAQREVAKPDGYVEIMPGLKFEVQNGGDMAVGQFKLLEIAMARMQAKGPNAAMSGTDPRDQSGRAILAQQAGGAAANEPLADGLRQWKRRIYEIAWMAVRKYWTGERWLRVTDDAGSTQWVGLNRQIKLADELAAMPPDQRAQAMQAMQLQPGDPRLQQVVRTENDVSDLEVDIVIEEGVDVPAQAAEQFQALSQMVPALPPPMQMPAWKILIQSSAFKDKGKLLEEFTKAEQGAAQQAQQMAPLTHADAVADVRVKESQALLNESRAMDAQHGAVAKVAAVHRAAAESPGIPEVGPPVMPDEPEGGPQPMGDEPE